MTDKLLLFTWQPTLIEVSAAGILTGEANHADTTLAFDKTKKAFVYTMVGTNGFRLTHGRAFDLKVIQNFGTGTISVRVLPAGDTLLANAKEITTVAVNGREEVNHKFSAGETVLFVTTLVTRFTLAVKENTDHLL